MRSPAIVVALALTAAALAQDAPRAPERWVVQATGPVTLTMEVGKQITAWARSADGEWHRVAITAREDRVELALGPEEIRGGAALIVIDPPRWLDLEDAQPPTVVRFVVNSRNHTADTEVNLGWIEELPETIVLVARDDANPIDPRSVCVSANGAALRPGDPGVRFELRGERQGRLLVRPGQIDGLTGAVRARVELVIDDYAVDELDTRRSVSWALAPRLTLPDGTLVLVDSLTADAGWADWSVLVDGEVMKEGDPTTAGKTWLSDNREDEHWIVFRFPEPRAVNGIDLWWPWYETWRTSRNYEVQTWDGKRWVTQVTVTDQEERQHSEHRFRPVTTTGVRVLQAPMGGQAERRDLMWLAEAQVSFAP